MIKFKKIDLKDKYVKEAYISDCEEYMIIFRLDDFGFIYSKSNILNSYDYNYKGYSYYKMGNGSVDWVLSINDKEKIKNIINKSILMEKELYVKMINIHFKARHKKQNKELLKIYISKLRKLKECY